MSEIYKDSFEKGMNASIINIEEFETGTSLNNVYEQNVSMLVKSKLFALNEITFDNEENLNETTISFAPKINFKQSIIIPEISKFSLE